MKHLTKVRAAKIHNESQNSKSGTPNREEGNAEEMKKSPKDASMANKRIKDTPLQ